MFTPATARKAQSISMKTQAVPLPCFLWFSSGGGVSDIVSRVRASTRTWKVFKVDGHEYFLELYLGSTFGSCFGEGYRSTCFGHRYRSNRSKGTEDKKKKSFFFVSVQQGAQEWRVMGDRSEQKEQPSLRQHLTMWT
jgi:hypothetical protein